MNQKVSINKYLWDFSNAFGCSADPIWKYYSITFTSGNVFFPATTYFMALKMSLCRIFVVAKLTNDRCGTAALLILLLILLLRHWNKNKKFHNEYEKLKRKKCNLPHRSCALSNLMRSRGPFFLTRFFTEQCGAPAR